MFAKNGKYGQALHMSYGSVFAAEMNEGMDGSHPALASVLRSLRKYSGLDRKQEVIEVSLEDNMASRMVRKGIPVAVTAANENRPGVSYDRTVF